MSIFFTDFNEAWIIEYNRLDPKKDLEKREEIYTKYIHEPFRKIAHYVVARYQFNRTLGKREDLVQDTISYLWLKISMFNSEKGNAFSYFTKIALNYLVLKSKRRQRDDLMFVSIDEIDEASKAISDVSELISYSESVGDEEEDKELAQSVAKDKIDLLIEILHSDDIKKHFYKSSIKLLYGLVVTLRMYKHIDDISREGVIAMMVAYTGVSEIIIGTFIRKVKNILNKSSYDIKIF